MTGLSIANQFDRTRLARVADGLAVAVAVSMPWSTSATGILLVLWLLALIPTLDWADLRRTIATPAGGLPVLLFLLGVIGMLWADVTLIERWKGLDSFFKLLVIPLLLVQFQRSDRGAFVLIGYLASCTVLLVAGTIVNLLPGLPLVHVNADHVLVRNAPTQSGEFVTCIFGLIYFATDLMNKERQRAAVGSLLLALAFLANILYVALSRTALVVIVALAILFAFKKLSGRGSLIFLGGVLLIGVAAWVSSPYLRDRTITAWNDVMKYAAYDDQNSAGERLEFDKKSLTFILRAPVFGHGTGSIAELFSRSVIGHTGAASSATTNPHNQTFAVAIQLGLIGAAVLWAMWIAHLSLFRGNGLAEWVGMVLVVQNIVGSLLNSHLFDFVQGWVYVFGVGVVGGMALQRQMRSDQAT